MWTPIPVPSYPGPARAGRPAAAAGVQRGERAGAGGGDAVHRARPGRRGPQREAARGEDGLDAAAVGVRFPGVPQAGNRALDAEGRLAAAAGLDDGSVQDHVRQPVLVRPLQRLVLVRGLSGEHVDDLVPAAASRGAGYAVAAGQRVAGCAVAEPAHAQHRPRPSPGSPVS
jgi:hypothetical protein